MLRPFDPSKDREAVRRIWREIGWLELEPNSEAVEVVDKWVDAGRALVAEVEGEAECMVLTAPGHLTFLDQSLPASLVTGVTTSRIVRKQGHALRLTAKAIAADVEEGAVIAALGMFDQGFYNRIGFGNSAYDNYVSFDPALLNVPSKHRKPVRLTKSDWKLVHDARLARPMRHGQCTVHHEIATLGGMSERGGRFGLGYIDAVTGELTHHFWCTPKGERGPYCIEWMVFHTREQFLELMALIKNMGDQVRMVRMFEPPGIQLQDLMRQPFKQIQMTEKSDYSAGISARAFFQYRICNLPACLEKTHLACGDLKFNLSLSDPIETVLEEDSNWKGVAGNYVVTVGNTCSAALGRDTSLLTLTATVGAFTRLWLGVRPASGLSYTDEIEAPQDLLHQLDEAFALPIPRNDWDF